VLVAAAVVVGRLLEDVGHRHALQLEAVALLDQVPGLVVLVLVGGQVVVGVDLRRRLLDVDHRPIAVRVVLGSLGRNVGQYARIGRATVLEVLDRGQVKVLFEVEDHPRQVQRRLVAGVEVLVHGAVGHLNRAVLVPVEALAVDHAEALAAQDVDRLLAVAVLAGVPADGDFGLEDVTAHRREALALRDHQLNAGVLPRADPGDLTILRDHR